MRKLRLGIVGWNAEVRSYISFIEDGLIEGVKVVALYCPNRHIKSEIQSYYPFIPIYFRYEKMMQEEHIEAVLSFHSSYHYSTL